MEHFTYAKEFRVKTMIENYDTEHNIYCARMQFEDEINFFKKSSLKELKEIMMRNSDTKNIFSDWNSAMSYLADNTEFILTFMKKHKGESWLIDLRAS